MHTRVISFRLILTLLFSCLFLFSACGSSDTGQSSSPTPSPTPAIDAYGTPVAFPKTAPQRIISLTPNISEILAALNLKSRVVGVDSYTDYPSDMASLPKISNMGNYNVEQIIGLKPDLILSADKFSKDVYSKLTAAGLHVVDLAFNDVSQTLQEISVIGRLTFTQDAATKLVQQMQQQIDPIKAKVAGTKSEKVLLEIDDSTPGKPYVFGSGSFGDNLLQDAKGTNIFEDKSGFPQVSDEAIIAANPDVVILTELLQYGGNPNDVYKRPNWGGIEAVKTHHVYRINSNIMQRPGPRLVQGLRCLAQIVHPDKFSEALPAYCTATV